MYIVVDLDGTICDISHRVDYAKTKQWDEFHSRLSEDKPHKEVAEFLATIGPHVQVIGCTGRNEKWRLKTIDWFNRQQIAIDELFMRPDDDYTPDHELKVRMLEEFFGSKEEVLASVAFCLDDRDRVVEAFRNYGLPCWQVRAGDY